MSGRHVPDLFAVYTAASLEQPGLLAAPSPAFLEAVELKWRAHQDNRLANKDGSIREDVCATLERLGIQHEAARWCDRSKQYIEVAVTSTDPPLALQLPPKLSPGGSHLSADEASTPRTQLRLRMLAAHGWRPVTVGSWLAQETPEQKEELLRSAMAAE